MLIVVMARSALSQSIFIGGGYVLSNRAAGMSAYVADPDYAHAVLLNPARLSFADNLYIGSDYEHFSWEGGQPFLQNPPSYLVQNGNLSTWNFSAAFPVGPLGFGASFSAFELAGWRTTTSALGAAVRLPLGFSIGIAGKYLTLVQGSYVFTAIPASDYQVRSTVRKFTFDVGAGNRVILADNMFFRAILSVGATFSNALPKATLNRVAPFQVSQNSDVELPRVFSCGVAYTFASNYRVADFELFKVTGAVDYSHLLSNSDPLDNFVSQKDQYRVGLETMALGILAVRVGYTMKTPKIIYSDPGNDLYFSRMGSGFSYGFSLRFPTKLVLPWLPVTSLELSYAKNPEWNSGMYHDLFGVICEMQL